MKQQLMWLLLVIITGLGALLTSRVVRTMFKEAVLHPKQQCTIEVSENRVEVMPDQKSPVEEVNNVRS